MSFFFFLVIIYIFKTVATKEERYEVLLKAYGQPLKGDTEAKRDALRAFAGIPQDGQ